MLITQGAVIENTNGTRILKVITDRSEGKDSGILPEEEEVMCPKKATPYNNLWENEIQYALFADGSCHIVEKYWKRKAGVWNFTWWVTEGTEGQGEASQFAEVKSIHLALDISEWEKWPVFYLYTDTWMVANALWRVFTTMEVEQQAAQRQTHLGCPIVTYVHVAYSYA